MKIPIEMATHAPSFNVLTDRCGTDSSRSDTRCTKAPRAVVSNGWLALTLGHRLLATVRRSEGDMTFAGVLDLRTGGALALVGGGWAKLVVGVATVTTLAAIFQAGAIRLRLLRRRVRPTRWSTPRTVRCAEWSRMGAHPILGFPSRPHRLVPCAGSHRHLSPRGQRHSRLPRS